MPSPGSPLERARALADELLRPVAEQVDRTVVPRSHVDAWARAGLLGLSGPRSHGGGGAPAQVAREVSEVLAGACGATWFVVAQHALPLAAVAASMNEPLREPLAARGSCSGEVLAGVGVAQLRRPGPPAVDRHPGSTAAGGSTVGSAGSPAGASATSCSWPPSTADGRTVLALLPAREGAGITASAPLALAAMSATRTVALDLDGLLVGDDDVVDVQPTAQWLAADAVKTANTGPHTFGLQREAVRRLDETAARRGDATAAALAQQLASEGERLRRVAYVLVDDVPADEQLDDRLAVRASALELTVRTTTALVAATGGGAMALDAAPQRLAREAVFHLVQAQTAPVREATLQLLRDVS